MTKTLKARVLTGRYKDQIAIITNVSTDELGRQFAACKFPDGSRANLPTKELEQIPEEPPKEEARKNPASMPFVSGSMGSRTMNQAKSLVKNRHTIKPPQSSEEE